MGHYLKDAATGVLRARARSLGSIWILSAGSLVMGLTAREAGACLTILPPPALVGSPADGDMDVPTDVVPYYSKFAAILENGVEVDHAFSLVSADGDVVALSVESKYADDFELVFERPLEPNTEYTLSTTLKTNFDGTGESVEERLTFTTGNGPFDGTLEPPNAFLVHYYFAVPRASSCSPWQSATCVALTPQYAVVSTAIDEFGQEHSPEIRDASYFINLSGVNQGTNYTCERLQSRAPNGTLSEPVQLCPEDGPLYALGPDEDIACTSEGLTQSGVVVTENTNVDPPEGTDSGAAGKSDGDGDGDREPPGTEPDAGASSDDETTSAGCSLVPSGLRTAPIGGLVSTLLPMMWLARASRRRGER